LSNEDGINIMSFEKTLNDHVVPPYPGCGNYSTFRIAKESGLFDTSKGDLDSITK
jgi:hypothetical protein